MHLHSQEYWNKKLIEAVKEGNLKKAIEAIDKGADPNAKDTTNPDGPTALMVAIYSGSFNMVIFLLKYANANVNAEDNNKNTALIYAAKVGSEHSVWYLNENGADINHKNAFGEDAIGIAEKKGFSNIANYLRTRDLNYLNIDPDFIYQAKSAIDDEIKRIEYGKSSSKIKIRI